MPTKYLFLLLLNALNQNQEMTNKTIQKNEMEVSWYYNNDRIFFEMSAPTDGWVAIGFNSNRSITGTYLLMGHIVENQIDVSEHFTISPGNYKPISDFGEAVQVSAESGIQNSTHTKITFSLPVKPANTLARDLSPGLSYTMLLAYSQEDDFQHHSIIRTSINVKL